MNEFQAKRLARTYTHQVEAPAARVFPLLCPTREYDWIEDWECDLIWSASGVAENNCVFRTDRPLEGETFWMVTRYEPDAVIEFALFTPGSRVMKMDLALREGPAGRTTIRWTHTFTSLSRAGNDFLDLVTEERYLEKMNGLHQELDYYLRTGRRLAKTGSAHL
ncbi:MAG: hypothetical protein AB1896_06040 [Thermodesulfobacteriota bacterium]